jgi:hypothetical protein
VEHKLPRCTGISEATFYRWKHLYDGLVPSEVKRLRQVEEENGRLRKWLPTEARNLLVERTERLISTEHSKWIASHERAADTASARGSALKLDRRTGGDDNDGSRIRRIRW